MVGGHDQPRVYSVLPSIHFQHATPGGTHVAFDLVSFPLSWIDHSQLILHRHIAFTQAVSCKNVKNSDLHAGETADVDQRSRTLQQRRKRLDLLIEKVIDVQAPA